MKKFICSLLFSIFLLTSMGAQVIQGTSNVGNGGGIGDLSFGVKAGFGLSTLTSRNFVDISPKPGFYVGGIAEIPAFFDGFYLQPEALIQFQGADIGPSNLNLLYLHVPIMGKYHITDEIAVEVGPQIGVLLADNWDEDVALIDTKKLNLGLNIGGGYRLDDNFYFQLRFSPSLTKVIENTNTRNMAVQVGACYFF